MIRVGVLLCIENKDINDLIEKADSHQRTTLVRLMKAYLESLEWSPQGGTGDAEAN